MMSDDTLDATASDPGQQLTQLTLDLRGTRFTIERDTLMNLPESVLLCLFPNGLVLARQPKQPQSFDDDGNDDADDDEEVYLVDFDPQCLSYVLSFFKTAQDDFYGIDDQPGKFRPSAFGGNGGAHHYQQSSADFSDPNGLYGGGPGMGQNPLLNKQAIIVLREELEYFAIPPKRPRTAASGPGGKLTQPSGDRLATESDIDISKLETTNPESGHPTPALLSLKQSCGRALLDRKQIFTALQRNVNKENNLAEQHLIDMLCMSGFDRNDTWGFRALEPSRCCITSIALVLLKTGIAHAGELEAQGIRPDSAEANDYYDETGQTSMFQGMKVDHQQLATAQKLLLFWRKPARKCWWDGVDIVLPHPDQKPNPAAADSNDAASTAVSVGLSTVADATSAEPDAGMTPEEVEMLKNGTGRKVRVWARRVWTLELSLI
ncbi:uncharacterized protein PFL1_02682 [Pseudozyma flocculosa PF-1]|uniref:Related to WHI2 - growth regulation protein n=2 Tax=Pseudozyma flocculosa TaxID=84751 RepID=A0A5C3F217_9BASI|nr:uncharacterized protein PFL1_02682 [Pseudozyma flocculosa PF-1]EPQ30009.1 hypothetical protein PFL1_02682 [Pseudozyma flocculosa PF-1]SPO37331.1 related to WHI2 - growth regulation protein [Pseudozyma flocculosa]